MYHDVLQPGDIFSTMMRKVVMALSAIGALIVVVVLIQICMGIGSTGPSSYPIWFTVLAVLIGPWVYVKWTHTAPMRFGSIP